MPKLKKKIQKQDLAKVRTWITDDNPFSDYFRLTQVPDVLSNGKNGFLINGSPNLVRTTEVLIELTDVDGNTIFLQPIKNYNEGLARVISIEVYEDTPPGPAILTILGELAFDKNGNRVPDEWIGTYNVKWQKIINVDPSRPNTNPIRLYNKPVFAVSERLIPYRQSITGSLTSVSTGTIVGQYVPGGVFFVGDDITNQQRLVVPPYTNIVADSPIFIRQSAEGTFTALINGLPFTSSFDNVLNSFSARISKVFTGSDGLPVSRWSTSNYTHSYQLASTYITSSLVRSFADIKLSQLTTFTGDIQRAKFYVRGLDEGQKYELLEDIILESSELTVSQSITGEQVELGQIIDQPFIDQNWEDGIILNGNSYSLSGDVTGTYNSSNLIDSIVLSGSVAFTASVSSSTIPVLWTGIIMPLSVQSDTEYTFAGDLLCIKNNPDIEARIEVYLDGPILSNGQGNQFGFKIADLRSPPGQSRRLFNNFFTNFTSPSTDLAKLKFVIYSGEWYLSNIRVVSSRETGFNPDEIKILAPVIGRRFERLQFKVELYDANSNLVPLNIETDPIYFDGGNLVFRGPDTRIDGILTVSPSGSGPTLTSKGFQDRFGNFTDGQAIAIGPSVPRVKSKSTAFFAGTSSLGPEISVGDKLYGYYDSAQNEFILQIEGTVLVGSGSNFFDIRSLLPRNSSDKYFDRVRGGQGDFQELRGRRAITAGDWNNQIARMGLYTRGPAGYIPQPDTSLPNVSASVDPLAQPSITLITSQSITIPSNQTFYNELIYGNMNIDLQEDTLTDGFYNLQFTLTVKTSWISFASASASPGQILITDDTVGISNPGDFSPDPIINYPIPIPSGRTGDTLYIVTELNISFEPDTNL